MLDKLFERHKKSRVASDRSTRELVDARKRNRSELRASIYRYKDKFILCSVAGNTEYGEPLVLATDASDEQLGLALCDQLLQYTTKGNRDRPKSSLSDWEAYKASGAKSARSFEENAMFVYVTTVNTAINIQAAPRVSNEQELVAQCSISNGRTHAEMGATVRKAIKAAEVLRDAGML
jgi:hypothetical protein